MHPGRHGIRIGCDLHILVDSPETCLHKPCRAFCPFSDIVTGQRTWGSGIKKDTGETLPTCPSSSLKPKPLTFPIPRPTRVSQWASLSVLNHSNLEQMLDDNFRERIFPEVRTSR